MAKRRMFNVSIIEDDVFMDMPLSSQALYIHLCMNADDDGFVSPKRVLRMTGATQDDLKILVAKRYILIFDSGVAVVKHWHQNNTIRKDRSIPTTYQAEIKQLTFNEWGAYTEKKNVSRLTTKNRGTETISQPDDNQMTTQIRLEQNRIVINNTKVLLAEKPPAKKTGSKDINDMFDYWQQTLGYSLTSKRQANRYACSNLIKKFGVADLKRLIDGVGQANSDRYAPKISDFCDLQSKLNQLLAWGKNHNQKGQVYRV